MQPASPPGFGPPRRARKSSNTRTAHQATQAGAGPDIITRVLTLTDEDADTLLHFPLTVIDSAYVYRGPHGSYRVQDYVGGQQPVLGAGYDTKTGRASDYILGMTPDSVVRWSLCNEVSRIVIHTGR